MRKLVDGALAKLDKAQSTEDVLAIARDLQATLAQGQPQAPDIRQAQPKGEGKGESNPKSQKGAAKAKEKGEGEGEGKATGEPETARWTGKGRWRRE